QRLVHREFYLFASIGSDFDLAGYERCSYMVSALTRHSRSPTSVRQSIRIRATASVDVESKGCPRYPFLELCWMDREFPGGAESYYWVPLRYLHASHGNQRRNPESVSQNALLTAEAQSTILPAIYLPPQSLPAPLSVQYDTQKSILVQFARSV